MHPLLSIESTRSMLVLGNEAIARGALEHDFMVVVLDNGATGMTGRQPHPGVDLSHLNRSGGRTRQHPGGPHIRRSGGRGWHHAADVGIPRHGPARWCGGIHGPAR